jgi:hypothetical protein
MWLGETLLVDINRAGDKVQEDFTTRGWRTELVLHFSVTQASALYHYFMYP